MRPGLAIAELLVFWFCAVTCTGGYSFSSFVLAGLNLSASTAVKLHHSVQHTWTPRMRFAMFSVCTLWA